MAVTERVKALIIEDSQESADEIANALRQSGLHPECIRVGTESDFDSSLTPSVDVILAELQMPEFDALAALRKLRERDLDIPLIVVASQLDEETVVASVSEGAVDILTRDGFSRLGETVKRALANCKLRRERVEVEQRYKALVEQSLTGVYLIVGDVFAYFNQAGAEIFGYQPEEIIGILGPMDLTHPDDRDRVRANIRKRMSGETEGMRYIFTGLRKDGQSLFCEVHGRTVLYQGQAAIIGTLVDVTDRIRGQTHLQLLQSLTEAISVAPDLPRALRVALERVCEATGWTYGEVWLPDTQGDRLRLAAAWHHLNSDELEAFQTRSEALSFPVGQGLLGAVWQTRQHKWVENVAVLSQEEFSRAQLAAEAGLKAALAVPILAEADVLAVLAFFLKATKDEDQHLTELVSGVAAQLGTLIRHKRAEEALRESEARFRRLAENAKDLIMRYRLWPERGFEYVSPASTALTGEPPEAFYRDADLIIERTHPEDRPLLQAVLAGQSFPAGGLELRMLRGDGELVWIEQVFVPVEDEDARVVALEMIARDITERKQSEARIESQMNRLAALRMIDMAISGSMDLRVTFNVLLEEISAQLKVDAADILTFDHDSNSLQFAAARGFRTSALQHTHLRLGDGHAGQAALLRQIVHVPDLRQLETGFDRSPLFETEDFVTYFGVPLMAKGQVRGVLELFHRQPLEPDQEWLDFLEAIAGQAAIAIDNTVLFEELQRFNMDLTLAYDATIEGWGRALELRDRETQGHTRRVTVATLRLARQLGVTGRHLLHIQRGAMLHDIGKMGIPDSILLKPDKLTAEEWEIMQLHPVYAYEMLAPIDYLRPSLEIPYCHHEKWDGSGYPRGIKGGQIPLAARVFAIIDVWDALRSDRPYRPAWNDLEVVEYLHEQTGSHFDPEVAEVFLEMEADLRRQVHAL